jgi:multidrug efflux pump subunit AcrA (membrane-fusion protein)
MKGYWLLGIALVILMFFGVKWLLDGSSASSDQKKHDAEVNTPPDKVVCWGNFDGEKGVAGLDPRQFGDVTDVVPENTKVKKGTVLLQIDDNIAKLKVEAAQQQLTQAKQLTRLYELQAIEAKRSLDAVVREATREIDRLKPNGSPAQIKEAQQLLADKKEAAEAKLEQIKLQNAPLKIAMADTQLKEAEAMLKYFQVLAPDHGTVLRVNVRKGETLGPSAMRHSVEFLPEAATIVKAEVLQEWGRYIGKGQEVLIEDDTYNGPTWTGTVKSVSQWYAQTRSPVIEPFRMNDVRTLECIIELKDAKDASTPRIGQRVRAKIDISKK